MPYTIHMAFLLNTLKVMGIKCLNRSPSAYSLHPYSITFQCFEFFTTWVPLMSRLGLSVFSNGRALYEFGFIVLGIFYFFFGGGRKVWAVVLFLIENSVMLIRLEYFSRFVG